jgi:hypothetical protein
MKHATANGGTAELEMPAPAEPGKPARERFKRRFESFRGDADAIRNDRSGGAVDVELTMMLLREENARLKAERHRPAGVGVMVDRLRVIASDQDQYEGADDVWGLLSECMTIHDGLARACGEVQDAITAVEERLSQLGVKLVGSAARREVTPSRQALPASEYAMEGSGSGRDLVSPIV